VIYSGLVALKKESSLNQNFADKTEEIDKGALTPTLPEKDELEQRPSEEIKKPVASERSEVKTEEEKYYANYKLPADLDTIAKDIEISLSQSKGSKEKVELFKKLVKLESMLSALGEFKNCEESFKKGEKDPCTFESNDSWKREEWLKTTGEEHPLNKIKEALWNNLKGLRKAENLDEIEKSLLETDKMLRRRINAIMRKIQRG